jgi:hypothetical protein
MRIRKEQSAPLKAQEAWLRSRVAAYLDRPRPPSRSAQVTPLDSFGCASPGFRRVRSRECLTTASHTVEEPLSFARRVTLGSSRIRFIGIIVWCGLVVDRRSGRHVGKTRNVPPVCVMHRTRVRRATQDDQKAQGQDRTHRFSPIDPAATVR